MSLYSTKQTKETISNNRFTCILSSPKNVRRWKRYERTLVTTKSYIPNDDDCLPKLDESLSLIFLLHYISSDFVVSVSGEDDLAVCPVLSPHCKQVWLHNGTAKPSAEQEDINVNIAWKAYDHIFLFSGRKIPNFSS